MLRGANQYELSICCCRFQGFVGCFNQVIWPEVLHNKLGWACAATDSLLFFLEKNVSHYYPSIYERLPVCFLNEEQNGEIPRE